MKALAINASTRKDGNTAILINTVLKAMILKLNRKQFRKENKRG